MEIEVKNNAMLGNLDSNKLHTELMRLQQENQELKKQLEVGEEQYNDLVEEIEKMQEQLSSNTLQLDNQQKEFIEYLEDKIERCEENIKETKKWLDVEEIHSNVKSDLHLSKVVKRNYEEILSKYKEIVGDENE